MLSTALAKLETGKLSIADFSQRFTRSRWEAAMAANSSLLHLGWDIQNILYEWAAFPDLISPASVAGQIRESLAENNVILPDIAIPGAHASRRR
jgi:hypothetical protein